MTPRGRQSEPPARDAFVSLLRPRPLLSSARSFCSAATFPSFARFLHAPATPLLRPSLYRGHDLSLARSFGAHREDLEEELAVGVPPVLPQTEQQAVRLLGDGAREPEALLQSRVQKLHEWHHLASLELCKSGKGGEAGARRGAETRAENAEASKRRGAHAFAHPPLRVVFFIPRPLACPFARTGVGEPLLPDLLDPFFGLALGHVLVPDLRCWMAGRIEGAGAAVCRRTPSSRSLPACRCALSSRSLPTRRRAPSLCPIPALPRPCSAGFVVACPQTHLCHGSEDLWDVRRSPHPNELAVPDALAVLLEQLHVLVHGRGAVLCDFLFLQLRDDLGALHARRKGGGG